MPKHVSLSGELTILFEGVRGARALVEKITQNQCSDDKESAETANAVAALLVLLTERLRCLDRVVRGTLDAAVLVCPQNEALVPNGEVREGEEDVVLRAWSEKRVLRHHRTEWKRAKRRLTQKNTAKAGAS